MRDPKHSSSSSGSHGGLTGAGDGAVGDLGLSLKAARSDKGLELSEVAELTHVRREYLLALEEGRYQDLPEDVYARNFVRLYAQAVGLSPDRAIAAYQSERKRAGGLSTLEMKLEQERRGDPPPRAKRKPRGGSGGLPRLGTVLPTFVLVAALVALAVWGFNSLLFRPATPATPTAGAVVTPGAGAADAGGAAPPVTVPSVVPGAAAASEDPVTILVSVTSSPPGASVSIDGYVLPGTTPILDAPVTARAGRVLNVSLDGYQTLTQPVDLLEPQTLHVELSVDAPAVAAGQPVTETPVAASSDQVALSIRASTWLEVYRGTTRMGGERLVYRTAEPGESFVFDLPVYVHVGNAAGVEAVLGDTALGAMGSAGAVVGRAFVGQ